jgi:small conductance mechanosensitive channel
MNLSDRTVDALIAGTVGVVVIVATRWALAYASTRYERRLAGRDPDGAARRRTTIGFLRKVIVAIIAAIAIWNVLSLYDATSEIGKAILASSAVLALFVGLAFSTPLSNLGSGLLVVFSQPLRLGDRVTVAEQTGFVEEMSLLYTTLVTDDARRVFIPNSQLTASTIVNRTIRDPRRAVSATFPVRLGAPIGLAREALTAACRLPGTLGDTPRVLVGDPTENVVWLTTMVYASLDADVAQLGSELREAGIAALAKEGFLPTVATA